MRRKAPPLNLLNAWHVTNVMNVMKRPKRKLDKNLTIFMGKGFPTEFGRGHAKKRVEAPPAGPPGQSFDKVIRFPYRRYAPRAGNKVKGDRDGRPLGY